MTTDFEWDKETKDTKNRAKHKIALEQAKRLDWSTAKFEIDDRREYEEVRVVAYGLLENRLFVCVFTDRDGKRRIISLRKANKREIKRYGVQESGPSVE